MMPISRTLYTSLSVLLLGLLAVASPGQEKPTQEGIDFFEKKIERYL